MAKEAASSPLEDLDLSGEEVQRLTSAFQDPEFRRMFSEYAEELTDPENRRRYENANIMLNVAEAVNKMRTEK